MDFPINAIIKSKDDYKQMVEDEIIQSKSLIRDLMNTLEQSQVEINRLTQKKASVTAQLQRVQSNLDSVTKEEIRDLYTQAMDSQQRLLIMRGQIEKTQIQLTEINKYVDKLEQFREFLVDASEETHARKSGSSGIETVKMLVLSEESERERLSRLMHDGPAQTLSNFIVQAEIVTKLFEIDPTKANDELEKLKTASMNTFQKIRRFINDLRPMMLEELGFIPTIRKYVNVIKEQTGVDINFSVSGSEKKMDDFVEIFIFRSLQEIISTSLHRNQEMLTKLHIDLSLIMENSQVTVQVQDNGKAHTVETEDRITGTSMTQIQERAEMLGGTFEIVANGEGTEVNLKFPVG